MNALKVLSRPKIACYFKSYRMEIENNQKECPRSRVPYNRRSDQEREYIPIHALNSRVLPPLINLI